MTASSEGPTIEFVVEAGQEHCPRLKVTIAGKTFPLDLTAPQAAQLGTALLAASAAAILKPSQIAEGMQIESALLPVHSWKIARSKSTGRPVIELETVGGASLHFQFNPQAAEEFGASLASAGKSRPTAGT
jgi:hypothetical protein